MRPAGLILSLLALAGLAGCGDSSPRTEIRLPDGFRLTTVASGVGQPTNLAFDRGGRMWTTSAGYERRSTDGVWFTPRPGARPVHVISGLRSALGLTWLRGELYVAHAFSGSRTVGQVAAYSRFDGRRFGRRRIVLARLPTGLHQIDSIIPGPGGRLYLGIGSVADARRGPSPLSASVVSFLAGGGGLRVEARGLRNPYGLAFVPGTSHLLVSDNGRDRLGAGRPPDELNLIDVARGPVDLGFPACFGQGGAPCRGTVAPLAALAPHAAAGGVAVSPRRGPFGLSAYVAENGSTNASPPTGNLVVRVSMRPAGSGYRATVHPFASGFAPHDPLGAAIGPDGALYIALHSSGKVVRIAPRHPVQERSTKG